MHTQDGCRDEALCGFTKVEANPSTKEQSYCVEIKPHQALLMLIYEEHSLFSYIEEAPNINNKTQRMN